MPIVNPSTFAPADNTLLGLLAASSGSSLVGFIQSGTGAVARTVQSKERDVVSVFDFMTAAQIADVQAKTLTVDVTTALQASIDAVLNVNGGRLVWPDGFYKITSALTIALYTGWRMSAASRGGCEIVQDTDNTPIFKFTKENAHSWEIANFQFSWTNNQASTNTLANALYFDFDTQTGAGAYNGRVDNIIFDKGYYLARTNPAAANLLWKTKFTKIIVGSNTSGGICSIVPTTGGSPNNSFDDVYIRADSIVAASSIFNLNACGSTQMDNIEVNQATNGCIMINASGGTTIDCGTFELEVGTYAVNDGKLIQFADSSLSFKRFTAGTLTVNPGGGNKVNLFRSAGGTAFNIRIGVLDVGNNTITSGAGYVVNTTSTQGNTFVVEHIKTLNNFNLTDIASTGAANGMMVDQYIYPHLSADRGDADVTLAPGDEPIQFFNTTLTAGRAVTLPVHASNPTNIFNGLSYTVVRDATTPGNFILSIKNSSGGTLAEIPKNTRGKVTMAYKRLAWQIVGYELFNGGGVSADRGDSAVTLQVNQEASTQIFATVITADRAVTLNTTNARVGDRFIILRKASATGAFNINIGTGPLKALGTAGSSCEVRYDGATWFLAAYGVL